MSQGSLARRGGGGFLVGRRKKGEGEDYKGALYDSPERVLLISGGNWPCRKDEGGGGGENVKGGKIYLPWTSGKMCRTREPSPPEVIKEEPKPVTETAAQKPSVVVIVHKRKKGKKPLQSLVNDMAETST